MDESGLKLREGANFLTGEVYQPGSCSQEVMLAALQDPVLAILHAANWYMTSATTGVRFSFTALSLYLFKNGFESV
jgi:hypothetical protein